MPSSSQDEGFFAVFVLSDGEKLRISWDHSIAPGAMSVGRDGKIVCADRQKAQTSGSVSGEACQRRRTLKLSRKDHKAAVVPACINQKIADT